ncbi:MAG TPA: GntR family transcriptional regulator [Candidatus Atribacteria bacterium]|nr:GntR family transcriptional regulator [Candidatus Atribacteria bacterium]HPT78963.1 GntR family transcriptional regulator [Candidatus Atribacteria bacterium]
MTWEIKSDRPIYSQLTELIKLKICSGEYPLGSKLPSVRDLAKEASVNPNTMQRALASLEEEGLLVSNRTVGRFVTEDISRIKQVRNQLAREHVKIFLENMTRLGFDHEDIVSVISEMEKEMRE